MKLIQPYLSIFKDYDAIMHQQFKDRYLPFQQLKTALESDIYFNLDMKTIGYSEKLNPIYVIHIGKGNKKVLIWSQMHGNESTTTKAILDLLKYFGTSKGIAELILNECQISIIPMLNPDGASKYNRLNANNMDLNRDAVDRSQKETRCFFNYLKDFQPDYCFNMHAQRTIFGAGNTSKPASMSFLAPSYNEELTINTNRAKAMQLIAGASKVLNAFIPGQIARYDDAYNPNCYGDCIQKLGIPTVLFEAGHMPQDYCRNETRKFVLLGLLKMLNMISESKDTSFTTRDYFNIPVNQKTFVDILIKHVKNLNISQIGIQYKEILNESKLVFQPYIYSLEERDIFNAHRLIDAKNEIIMVDGKEELEQGQVINNLKIGNEIIDIAPMACL